jgi:type 1 glutamine amidotransferase
MKKVLIVSDGLFHPPRRGRRTLQRVLRCLEGYAFEAIRSLEDSPAELAGYATLVLYYHHKAISAPALARLEGFVREGGGVLALHAATASFKGTQPYFAILGGRFTGHGNVEEFALRKVNDDVFAGIGDFTVRDELYLHELQPGIQVHFTAGFEGRQVPAVWTYRYGKGRVCYAVPGHTAGTLDNPTYQALLQRALEWVAA